MGQSLKSYAAYGRARTKTLHDDENNRGYPELSGALLSLFYFSHCGSRFSTRAATPSVKSGSVTIRSTRATESLWRRVRHDAGPYKSAAYSLAVSPEKQL